MFKKGVCFPLVMSFLCMACNPSTSDNAEQNADTLGAKIENAVDKIGDRLNQRSDESFVKEAVASYDRQLKMSSIARELATSPDVKSAARRMETDHRIMGDKLKSYATVRNIELTEKQISDNDVGMNDAKGHEWDKLWIGRMLEDHQKMVKDFEDAQGDVEDGELKGIIANAIPKLRSHIEILKRLQGKVQ